MKHDEIINTIISTFNENKNSHVFLIDTNNLSYALNDIKDLIKKINCNNGGNDNCNICTSIDDETNLDLIIIRRTEREILVDSIKNLIKQFSTSAVTNKYRSYIIYECDKLNVKSANKLLKFMEEPEQDIIGFLITDNIQGVLTTIKSRCEIIKLHYKINNILDLLNISEEDYSKYYDCSCDLIKRLNHDKDYELMLNNKELSKKERTDLEKIFYLVTRIYEIKFENIVNNDYNNYEFVINLISLIDTDDINLITDRLRLLNTISGELKTNVNKELILNKFVLLWR